jgi:FMN phosphatase YigB (HAD superfamily)
LITTLLLDLDDTLLTNNMDRFLPEYLQRFGDFMSETVEPEKFVAQIMTGTNAMLQDADPTRTMERAFADVFYPSLALDEKKTLPILARFYHDVFPDLQSITETRPGARELVQAALAAGLEVVVATSPLFPIVAIEQRMTWAGVPREEFPFSLITSYECFHFAKPHLAYFTEIMGRLGKPLHEAAMIGNDQYDDHKPANELGMAVFHVGDDPDLPYPQGSLFDAINWLAEAASQTNPNAARQPQILVARLQGYLSALIGLLGNLPANAWRLRLKETEWALVEIICHLRDVELEVNRPRLERILDAEDAHLPAFDTDRWAEERDYHQQDGETALSEYVEGRLDLIGKLMDLDPKMWARKARHTLFGPTTLQEVIGIAADHDLLHLAQIRATLEGHDVPHGA